MGSGFRGLNSATEALYRNPALPSLNPAETRNRNLPKEPWTLTPPNPAASHSFFFSERTAAVLQEELASFGCKRKELEGFRVL